MTRELAATSSNGTKVARQPYRPLTATNRVITRPTSDSVGTTASPPIPLSRTNGADSNGYSSRGAVSP